MVLTQPLEGDGIAGRELRVLDKLDFFLDVQLWPLREKLDGERWLSNFTGSDRELATYLLDSFLYFSEPLVDAMLLAAFQGLSSSVVHTITTLGTAQQVWRDFYDSAIITYVTGETPNVTDSGYAFARKARQVLGIPEDRIKTPAEALAQIVAGRRPVVFLDDFVGSGSQCIHTWQRQYPLPGGETSSFADLATDNSVPIYYCPLVCAEIGMRNIRRVCKSLHLRPAHLVPKTSAVLSPLAHVWPERLRAAGREFVRRTSLDAGIPDSRGQQVDDWQGFRRLSLSIAFYNSVPDATLPLFYWQKNGWQPLVRKT